MEKSLFPVSPMQAYCCRVANAPDGSFQADMNMSFGLRFSGNLSEKLVDSFIARLRREGALRTRFESADGQLKQRFDPCFELPVHEWAPYPHDPAPIDAEVSEATKQWFAGRNIAEDFATSLSSFARYQKRTRIDPFTDAPMRLFQSVDPTGGICIFLTCHHAVADFAALSYIFNEHLENTNSERIRSDPIDQRFFSAAEEHYQAHILHAERDLSYWLDMLETSDARSATSLLEWPAVPCAQMTFDVCYDGTNADPNSLRSRYPQAFYLACFMMSWRSALMPGGDFVLSTIENRRSIEERELFGCFFRHVIWKAPNIDSSMSIEQVARQLVAQSMRSYAHLNVALDGILEAFHERHQSYPLIELSFTYRKLQIVDTIGPFELMPVNEAVLDERLRLQFHVTELRGRIIVQIVFNSDFFTHAEIDMIASAFIRKLSMDS